MLDVCVCMFCVIWISVMTDFVDLREFVVWFHVCRLTRKQKSGDRLKFVFSTNIILFAWLGSKYLLFNTHTHTHSLSDRFKSQLVLPSPPPPFFFLLSLWFSGQTVLTEKPNFYPYGKNKRNKNHHHLSIWQIFLKWFFCTFNLYAHNKVWQTSSC